MITHLDHPFLLALLMELMYEDEPQRRWLTFVLHCATKSETAYELQTEQLPLLLDVGIKGSG
jgi:hypothetical protein